MTFWDWLNWNLAANPGYVGGVTFGLFCVVMVVLSIIAVKVNGK